MSFSSFYEAAFKTLSAVEVGMASIQFTHILFRYSTGLQAFGDELRQHRDR
jgi:hypothetical protein